MTKKVITATLSVLLSGCCAYWNIWCPRCPLRVTASVSAYDVKATAKTPMGLRLDLRDVPDLKLDLQELDRRVTKMVACLEEEAAKVDHRPTDRSWQCQRFLEPAKWDRTCPIIKVVPEDKPSLCNPQWQFLPLPADPRLCVAKGLDPDPRCPCRWRTVTQSGLFIITPPALYLWELGGLITGCYNLWASPMARCLVL